MTFARLIHADWSIHPRKRWLAEARRGGAGWHVSAPVPVPDSATLVTDLERGAGPALAGFDFPIGLPAAYARRAGIARFPDWLAGLDTPHWAQALTVCREAAEISLHRPFYPHSPGGRRVADLVAALGLDGRADLMRACDRGEAGKRQACPLFWTLGANQVGKAAIAGWREVVIPALARGASLWPFDGKLGHLASTGGLTLCETYPAEAYGQIGAPFPPGASKRRQADRARATAGLVARTAGRGITLSPETLAALANGFGPAEEGEDPFDALMGLLGMIEVVEGRVPEAPPGLAADPVEGWILGRG